MIYIYTYMFMCIYTLYICVCIYIYVCTKTKLVMCVCIFIYTPPPRLPLHGVGHMCPKEISYHKTIVLITDKVHSFSDFVYCILFFCRFEHLVSLKIKQTNFIFFEY